MKHLITCILTILFILSLITACGPSPETVATMTASAWTPTPKPTLTPTPLPFDLSVSLVGEGGESITFGAYVKATEHEEVMVNESGSVELLNLPIPNVEVSIRAQGYQPSTETVMLEPGKNSTTITLAVDPLQINPSTACPEGSKVLYIEDFEDSYVQDWTEGLNRPMWLFEDVEGRGKVATFTGEGTQVFGTPITEGQNYGNMLWKFDFKGGDTHFLLHGFEGQPEKYRVVVQPNREGIVIIHEEEDVHQAAAQRGYRGEEWASAAIAYFNGSIEFWLDNEFWVALDDPNPIETGGIGFITNSEGVPFSLDNMVICELNEPYSPIVEEEIEE